MSIQPKDKVYFCSAASRYAQELLPGTASNYKCFILVEYFEPFPAKIIQSNLESSCLKKWGKIAKERNGKVVLIRNRSSSKEKRKIIFVDFIQKKYCEVVINAEDYHTVDLESIISCKNTIWQKKPFFIVCTNGKKDKCCSKFGFPVYKFLESIFMEGSTWECTHIGGDRFAANLVYMPFGIYYGRVTVEDIPLIVEACRENKIYENNYRGLSQLSFLYQSIEYYLRKYTDDFEIIFPMKILHRKNIENEIIFDVETKNGIFQISVTKQVILYPHLLTCTSKKRENVVKYLLNFINKIFTP